ncbi:MAG: hypothetical protein JNJ89_00365 [Rubrivivax sp.]|nr:hypothetical protein [Rubrivivax sp.]
MANLLMLATCLLAGWLLRRSHRVADHAHQALNAVIVHLSLPAVTLRTLHGFQFDRDHLLPVLMPWVLFVFGALLFGSLGRAPGLTRAQVGALTLVGGLGNTSFVGLPMIETLHGREGLGLGLLIDQLGSYLALSTLGVAAAAWYAADGAVRGAAVGGAVGGGVRASNASGGAIAAGATGVSGREMLRRIVTFPPVIALALALLLRPLPFKSIDERRVVAMSEVLPLGV